jgi:osmotically-inducible protein OsmY
VTFAVAEGVVTLAGRVRCSGKVAVVEGMAWAVPGVVHVVNNVTFQLADGT